MKYLLSLAPILLVLGLMIGRRWGAHKAGPAGLAAGLLIALVWFGLTPKVLWVSQGKGVLLSVFVLAVMWPALFLYHWHDRTGGIKAFARILEDAIPNRGMARVLLAWSLSAMLEGIAGFGLPIAVVAPMLVALGVPPIRAVAAVAAGHAWAVSFGDMGVIFQTLVAVVQMDAANLVPWAALLLGVACLLCGLLAASILGELRQWPKVAALSLVMAATQYALAATGLVALAGFGAGLSGIVAYLACAKLRRSKESGSSPREDETAREADCRLAFQTIGAYFALTVLMASVTLVPALRTQAQGPAWKPAFPEAVSATGFTTPAAPGQIFRPFTHPGTLISVVCVFGMVLSSGGMERSKKLTIEAARATWRSAGAASVGILSMVGLSTLMDHCGMSWLLANGLSQLLGAGYPLVSPCVGILGAFATGSNNNSNVLFGMLQKNVALLLHVNPDLLVAAQTAGGSLGSMLAPAKIIVGCSTVGLTGQEGAVMRKTVPYGLAIGLVIGGLTLVLALL